MHGSSSRSPAAPEQLHEGEENTTLLDPDNFHRSSNPAGDLAPPMSDLDKGIEARSQDSLQLLKPIGPWRSSTTSHPGDTRPTPYRGAATPTIVTVTSKIQHFWETNRSCMLVVTSSVFSAAMALFTKLLELSDDGMDAFQIIFIRMEVANIWCTSVLCWEGKPDSLMDLRK